MARQSVRAIVLDGARILLMKRNKFGKRYYTLIGGGIDVGEDAETALRRELREETGLEVGSMQLIYTENAPDPFGPQYIFKCAYLGGEPLLSSDSEEALVSKLGKNTYEPVWLPVRELLHITLRSESVKQALIAALASGFPKTVQELVWKAETVTSLNEQNKREEQHGTST